MTPGLFAAITLEVKGGGVAVAAQLMWRVLQEDWGAPCQSVTLIEEDASATEFQASTLARVKFGAPIRLEGDDYAALGGCRLDFEVTAKEVLQVELVVRRQRDRRNECSAEQAQNSGPASRNGSHDRSCLWKGGAARVCCSAVGFTNTHRR